jgi:signal peptidase I
MDREISEQDGRSRRASPRNWTWRRRVLVSVLGSAGLFAFVAACTYATSLRAFTVPSGSMLPTIAPGDRVGVEKDPRPRPVRGEIWVFQMPPSAALPGAVAIKRIMGLPGETIEVKAGRFLVDGRAIDEPYLAMPFTYSLSPRKLGLDEYFALGDNRDKSFDSHSWGPVARRYLIGRARGRLWPLRRLGGL